MVLFGSDCGELPEFTPLDPTLGNGLDAVRRVVEHAEIDLRLVVVDPEGRAPQTGQKLRP